METENGNQVAMSNSETGQSNEMVQIEAGQNGVQENKLTPELFKKFLESDEGKKSLEPILTAYGDKRVDQFKSTIEKQQEEKRQKDKEERLRREGNFEEIIKMEREKSERERIEKESLLKKIAEKELFENTVKNLSEKNLNDYIPVFNIDTSTIEGRIELAEFINTLRQRDKENVLKETMTIKAPAVSNIKPQNTSNQKLDYENIKEKSAEELKEILRKQGFRY